MLGGQQLLWAEQSGLENLNSIMWPRAAASAEVFWSGGRGDVTRRRRPHGAAAAARG